MVSKFLIRPYFCEGGYLRGVRLTSYEICMCIDNAPVSLQCDAFPPKW